MTAFYAFCIFAIGLVGGYMIGHDCGYEEGKLDGIAEEYYAGQER